MRRSTSSVSISRLIDDVEAPRAGHVRQRLGLADGAGKAVEDEARPVASGPNRCSLDHAHHDVIGDQLAPVHEVLGHSAPAPNRSPRRPGRRRRWRRGARRSGATAGPPGSPFPNPACPGRQCGQPGRSCARRLAVTNAGTLVVAQHELAVDLLHGLEGHTDGDEQGGAGERVVLDVPDGQEDGRQQGHQGQEKGARQGDPVEDVLQVPLGGGPGPDAGDVAALLADDLRLLVGVEGDAGVEVGEHRGSGRRTGRCTRLLGWARCVLIQVWTSLPQPVLGKTLEMRIGKYSTEAAKMIGTTPPVLTFIGM